MKEIEYIRIEGLELKKDPLNRPDIQRILNIQRANLKIDFDKFLLVVITHTFDDTQLPIELNYLFDSKNNELSENVNITIRGCINYRTKPHTKLWRGYNHLAIIEIENPNSELIQRLKPHRFRKRWDPTLILCKASDSDACKQKIKIALEKHEKFMKEHNADRWKYLQKEEREYKKNNE